MPAVVNFLTAKVSYFFKKNTIFYCFCGFYKKIKGFLTKLTKKQTFCSSFSLLVGFNFRKNKNPSP